MLKERKKEVGGGCQTKILYSVKVFLKNEGKERNFQRMNCKLVV
jgi:hypothetical protein